MFKDILKFWFEDIPQSAWWQVDPGFDTEIRQRFFPLWQQACQAELADWRHCAEGRLAEIILLDQFSRNMFRQQPQAFAQDGMALVLAQHAIAAGSLSQLPIGQCSFLLMPFMHSESVQIHQQAVLLFKNHSPDASYQFELKHQAIIERFGRYPHRNAILGRSSSPAELTFLTEAGSSF